MTEEDDDIQEYKKPWVGLTDEEFYMAFISTRYYKNPDNEFAKAIEDVLRKKNT